MADGNYRPVGTFSCEASPPNGGTVTQSGMPYDDVMTATATAATGYVFSEWTYIYSGAYSTENFISVNGNVLTVANNRRQDCYRSGSLHVVACFVPSVPPPTPTFNILTRVASGHGTTSGAGTYAQNQTHTVVATPTQGDVFVKWVCSDGTTYRTATVSRTTTANLVYEAYFRPPSTGELLYSPAAGGALLHVGGSLIYY